MKTYPRAEVHRHVYTDGRIVWRLWLVLSVIESWPIGGDITWAGAMERAQSLVHSERSKA